jgi:hypothetical protein
MKKLPFLTLPCPSTAVFRGPTLADVDRGLLVSLTCDDDGHERQVSLLFTKPRAFRRRAETYCTLWHVEDPYDTVCEVKPSDWVEELRNDAVPEWRDYWTMRHFIVYLDGFGCLEVVAESASLDDTRMNSAGT